MSVSEFYYAREDNVTAANDAVNVFGSTIYTLQFSADSWQNLSLTHVPDGADAGTTPDFDPDTQLARALRSGRGQKRLGVAQVPLGQLAGNPARHHGPRRIGDGLQPSGEQKLQLPTFGRAHRAQGLRTRRQRLGPKCCAGVSLLRPIQRIVCSPWSSVTTRCPSVSASTCT